MERSRVQFSGQAHIEYFIKTIVKYLPQVVIKRLWLNKGEMFTLGCSLSRYLLIFPILLLLGGMIAFIIPQKTQIAPLFPYEK